MRDLHFPCFGTECLGKDAPGEPESRPIDNVTFNFDFSTSDLSLEGMVSGKSATNYFELVDAGLLNPESD